MPYRHPTLPLRIDETSKASDDNNNSATEFSPRDSACMKKIASEKGFKSHLDHRTSLFSTSTPGAWCTFLQLELDQCQRFSPSAHCDGIRQLFTSDCGATKVKKLPHEDKEYNEIELEINAKLRGMEPKEFLDYAKQEKEYCKAMCAKCKEVPLPPGWEQQDVNKYCGAYVRNR